MAIPDPREVTEVDVEIGERIRARRNEMNLPLKHVAELVGVTYQQLQKYEIGENRVAAATLTRIAEALQVEPADLLPGASRRRAATADDGLSLQLQLVFSRVRSRRDRRFILELARRLSVEAPRRKGH